MSDTLDLFDPTPYIKPWARVRPVLDADRAAAARDSAIAAVGGDDADVEVWRAAYRAVIRRFAARGTPFLAEDVTAVVGIPGGLDHRAIGPLFLAMQRAGVIVPTGRVVNGKAVSRHRAPMREWRGT